MHDEERGGCFGDTGPASRAVVWNAPGWVVEKAGVVVVVAVVVVGDALESLASKTVAVRERRGGRYCWVAGEGGGGGGVGVAVLQVSECKRVWPGGGCEIAGTAAAKADTSLPGDPGAGFCRLSAGTQRIGGWRMSISRAAYEILFAPGLQHFEIILVEAAQHTQGERRQFCCTAASLAARPPDSASPQADG